MRVFFFFLFLFPLILRANSDAIFSDEEDLTLCHHVNVITGSLNLHFQDAIVEGAQKLPLVRTYTSAGALERSIEGDDLVLKNLLGHWLIQGGWNLMPHVHLILQPSENPREIKVYLPEKGGSTIEYLYEREDSEGVYLKPKISGGQCSGILSARTNPQNNRLKINQRRDQATLFLPDGGTRYYHIPKYENPKFHQTYYLELRKEILPSKHVVAYTFHDQMLVDVSVKNPQENKTFASLQFKLIKEGGGSHHFRFQAHSSDGRYFDYRSVNHKLRNYLSQVDSNCRPKERDHFIPGRRKKGARLHSLTFDDRFQFAAHYYEPINRKQSKKIGNHPSRRPYHIDKVRLIEAPVGMQNEMLPLAEFTYQPNRTDVKDSEGVITRYHHDESRLNSVDYYDDKEQSVSHLQFYWEGRFLKGKALHTPDSQALFSRTFRYDLSGNVTEEVLWGNLTGAAKDRFSPAPDGTLPDAEAFRKTYAYDPAFNVPLWEKEEGGPTYLYRYVPQTNLPSAQFFCDQDQILTRQFFIYDNDNLLIEEITDDGTTEDLQNLTGATMRLSKKYQRNGGTGLVEALLEQYWDFDQKCYRHIRRTDYTYTPQKQIATEAVYDANEQYRYTLTTDYDSQGRVIRKTTPLGQENLYTYSSTGELLFSKEVGSLTKTYTYTLSGRPLTCEESDAQGNRYLTRSTYDSKGRLISQTDKRGRTTLQSYDPFGKCYETKFPAVCNSDGSSYFPTIQFTYDFLGNLASTTSPQGESTKTLYNTLGKPTLVTRPDGAQTSHLYNINGTLAKTTYPDGSSVHYTYDIFQRTTSKTTYSPYNQILSQESWEYSAFHLLAHTDFRGLRTIYTYDGAGRLTSENRAGRESHYTYDPLGFLERTTDGNVTRVEIHNPAGLVTHTWEEDVAGHRENEMHFFYDEENRKCKATRITSLGEVTDHFSYDPEGRLCQHIDPLGAITQILQVEAEGGGLQKTTVDPLGNTTIETYDPLDRLIIKERKTPEGERVSKEEYFYDSSGNRIRQDVAVFQQTELIKTLTTRWEYDNLNQLIKQIEPEGKITTYTYDLLGNIHTKTLPNQTRLTYIHDSLGRLIEESSSDGSIHTLYHYFGPDPVEIHDLRRQNTLYRSYNLYGELTQETNPIGATLFWDYDQYGRVSEFTLPDRSSIAYTYSGKHLAAIHRKAPDGTQRYLHRYTQFDPNGKVAQEEHILSLGTTTTEHDLLERPSRQISPWHTHSASYGLSSLLEGTENTLVGSKQYRYDSLNQITQEAEQIYNFDSIGNPTDCQVDDRNQLLSTPSCTFQYDPNGNPSQRTTQNGTTVYRYDALGRLTEIIQPDKTIRYTYDPISRLLSKETLKDKKRTRIHYLYDREYEIGTLSDQSEVLQLKILGLGIQGDIGGAVALELEQKAYLPLHDFNGHIIALVSSSGSIAQTYPQDAFGREKTDPGSLNPWRFCSKRIEEGLIFFGKRFYDPSLGRWLTPDPAGFTEGPNLYVYVLNNPTNRLDLFGLSSRPILPEDSIFDFTINIPIDTINHAITTGSFINCEATKGNIKLDCVISCGHFHELRYTPEELKSGVVNILDHFHELLPKEGAVVGLVTYQNGILNSLDELNKIGSSVKNKIENTALSIGIYNPSKGVISDLTRVWNQKHGKENATTINTRQFMEALLGPIRNVNPSLIWMHFAHSEAGLIYKGAYSGMNPDTQELLREHLLVYTLGSAEPVPSRFGRKVKNIYSQRDHITKRFSKEYKDNPEYDIKYKECSSSISQMTMWFADHAILGNTYQDAIKVEIEKNRNLYGIYNGNHR